MSDWFFRFITGLSLLIIFVALDALFWWPLSAIVYEAPGSEIMVASGCAVVAAAITATLARHVSDLRSRGYWR